MRAFGVHEREEIWSALISSCLECWGVFGFSKTTVAELCRRANVSVGMFYKMFDCKEQLFFEASQQHEMGMFHEIESHLQKKPNKQGLIDGLKSVVRSAMDSVWFYQINIDMKKIVRKIGLDVQKTTESIVFDIYKPFFDRYNIKLKRPLIESIIIMSLLFGGVLFKDLLAVDIMPAIDFIIESTIANLVE